ncbi:hypothetical protein Tco_0221932 [Tanacetum coccineum]
MENSKRGSIPMQEKLRLSKSQGASTPAELKRMQNVPYASAVGSIIIQTDAERTSKSQTDILFVLKECIHRRERDVAYQWGLISESNDKEKNASTIHEDSDKSKM